MAGVSVTYNALVNQLEKQLSISVTTKEDPTKFKRKMAQAKFRQHIEGRMIFSVINKENNVYEITVALAPIASAVDIISLNKDKEL